MLATLELDYVQHLERGYCVNHPDVVAQTKEQVVDRAVKQLLTALQTNGFELDGNILKRGNGWLQYNAGTSKWQYSNDAGVTWQDMGSGGGIPSEIDDPVTIGSLMIRDDSATSGSLAVSPDNGVSWFPIHLVDFTELWFNFFVPPYIEAATQPGIETHQLENTGSLAVWRDTTLSQTWLLYNYAGMIQKVQLT